MRIKLLLLFRFKLVQVWMIWWIVIARSWTWWSMSCSWDCWSNEQEKHLWFPVGQIFSFFLLFLTASECVAIISSLSFRENNLWLSISSYPFLRSPTKTAFRSSWVKNTSVLLGLENLVTVIQINKIFRNLLHSPSEDTNPSSQIILWAVKVIKC